MNILAARNEQLSDIRILIVEDESIIARDIKDCLENIGYTVSAIAISGAEAIAQTAALQPNLVLMDIRLKGDMDGIQAAEQIWSRFRIPIVYSTGFSDKNTLERAKLTRPFGYVLKPVEERELYVAVETALQQYRVNQELQDREQWLTTVLRDIGDGVIVVDTDGRIKLLNLVAEALTGWTREEAAGKELPEVFQIVYEQTWELAQNPAREVLQRGTLVYLEDRILLISKDNTTIPIADSAAPLRDKNGAIAGVVIVFRDITQRRLVEERDLALRRAEQLEMQMAELQKLHQMKDEFLNTVSHELRSPLANMKMAIQMLEIALDQQGILITETGLETNKKTVRYLEILRDQCNQELVLVNDLLDLQRLNAETYVLSLNTIQLQDWIPHLAESFQARLHKNQQHLQVNIAADLAPITSDSSSLIRILSELLNNACKYTPIGGTITISVQALEATLETSLETSLETPYLDTQALEIQSLDIQVLETSLADVPLDTPLDTPSTEHDNSRQQNEKIDEMAFPQPLSFAISIANSGSEIPANELPHIFDQFYRIPALDSRSEGGTGLGLALVKRLVNYLGGAIQVESGSGRTCFIVELPSLLCDR